MAFLRWLKGLAIVILSAIFFIFAIPLALLILATENSAFALFFDALAFGIFLAGLILALYGLYIMKEETPKGRYRVE